MELKEIIKSRRAYRSIDPVSIDDESMREIIRLAGLSASCFNKQPWRFVVVTKDKPLAELKESLAKGNEWAKKSSLIIAIVSKPELDCQLKGKDYYLFDTGMATAFLILLLTENGLVAHPIVGFNEQKAKDALKVPNDMTIISLIVVGKHADKIYPELTEQQREFELNRPERLPVEKYLFDNTYQE